MRGSADEDVALRVLRDIENWKDGREALEIAHRISKVDSDIVRAELLEAVLRGYVYAPLPLLEEQFLSAAKDPVPERQIRAIERLSAAGERVAKTMVEIVKGPYRADVRYEALKALQDAGRDALVSETERADLYREYERVVWDRS